MRIGMVCPYTWDVPGGVMAHVRDLAEALIADGHQVSVIAPASDDAPLPYYVTSAGRAIPVPYNGSVARLAFGFLSANRVRKWLREGRFDVLHVHEPAVPSVGLLACWAARGPIVATFHASFQRSRALSVSAPVLQSALEKITGRIAVSDAARKTLVEHVGGDAVLIPNGVTVSRYAEGEPLPGWGPDGGVIGFLGRMDEPRKGLPVLLEAFTRLAPDRPGVRLLLAGPGDADDALAKVPASLRDRVGVLGMVSEHDKVRAYHSVDVFCAPNTHGESFGIVLAEAMAAGAAILASDIPAFRKVLGEGQAGALFTTGDAASLAQGAAALLDDPARRAKLSDEARLAVREYDWSTVARDVVRVYETVTATGAGVVEEEQTGRPRTAEPPAPEPRPAPARDHAEPDGQARPGRASEHAEADGQARPPEAAHVHPGEAR
ncbi:glycosyltransferase family 4 protein [Sphaerisporangium sp. TRM90804]|uniref:glycosyltransferase family 4 protein n=1 Tax=Sphaerisporangium sp. TRM90804 TaxID=3031113 RepID=UPI00244BE4BC|nr:glycosyltransferase family 4 protein [Sphaerisporangium sp. TRM90804]MDH2427376.1 glycosyltransferase family 4 protein [Sphaerisporangium sp. TRM90804]